jgi:hypothetical protein
LDGIARVQKPFPSSSMGTFFEVPKVRFKPNKAQKMMAYFIFDLQKFD